jgi:DNA-damage-inducible protein J
MSKSVVIQARISPDLKKEAELVLSGIGLTTSQAITLFFKQIQLQRGLPFPVKLPNAQTVKALEASRRGDVEKITSLEQLKQQWDEA